MPRLLLLSADFMPRPWSGIGVAVARQAHALAALGADVHVAVADRRDGAGSGESDRLHVHDLSRGRFPLDPREFDGVHVHSLRLAELAIEIRDRFHVPLVCTVHGWPHMEQPGSSLAMHWSRVQQRLLRCCDHVVFLSRSERDLGLTLVPDIEDRCSIVGHGVPPTIDATVAHDRRTGPVVFAGRFAASKGIALLTRVAERLLEAGRARLVIAGGHGDDRETAAIARLAARFPATCLTPGWLEPDALDALFARASLVLVPSLYEPFGLVALEAMRMGAPVLAADVGGLRDVVADRSGGRRLAFRDDRIWTDAVSEALADSGALARRGPADVARRFSCTDGARRLMREVYRIRAFSAA